LQFIAELLVKSALTLLVEWREGHLLWHLLRHTAVDW